MQNIRPAAVAGLFYPAESRQLAHDVQQLLAEARPFDLIPKALIVPHAGYVYSGAIAATAYATLRPIAPRIRRVVLLGPTHRVAVRGLALPGMDAFDTPLGRVTLLAHAPSPICRKSASARRHMHWNIRWKCNCRSCKAY